jgi:hypothetical protein
MSSSRRLPTLVRTTQTGSYALIGTMKLTNDRVWSLPRGVISLAPATCPCQDSLEY